eukprot:COSAG06_NODE_32162_length_510_cov_0.885645_2_plen_69_part_00
MVKTTYVAHQDTHNRLLTAFLEGKHDHFPRQARDKAYIRKSHLFAFGGVLSKGQGLLDVLHPLLELAL